MTPLTPAGQALLDEADGGVWLLDIAAIERQAADRALAGLAEPMTRLMMGEWLVKVNRWMTTGWRDSMFDEGVVLFGALIAEAALRAALLEVPE